MIETAMLKQRVESTFVKQYRRTSESFVHAPGRVNLIGEHTDYNNGFVFPLAINVGTNIAAGKRSDNTVKVLALDFDGDTDQFDLNEIVYDEGRGWTNYVRGVVLFLKKAFPQIGGAELVVSGNVPRGAGLSSSASFEIAIAKAFANLYALPLSGVQAALIGQQAENEFVGCACGIMDQLISALGQKDSAMLLDCADLSYKHTQLPDAYSVMIINSKVKRGLVDSEYNLRREQCEEAAAAMSCASLREASLDMLESNKSNMSETAYRRARHVLKENTRTLKMYDALKTEDIASMSHLMAESHYSMRDDFEITVPAIDTLVSIIATVLGEEGGARMTGGGFGGCVIALVPNHKVTLVKSAIQEKYHDQTGYKEDIYIVSAERGAFS